MMVPSVESALDTIVGRVTTLEHASGAGRIFELFVMTNLARGLQDAGFTVWLQRSNGTEILPSDSDRRFIQRGGAPTGVSPASAGPDNASVIGFRWRRRPKWEIWNGIQFGGRSGASHEIDIAIVPASVGAALRTAGGVPVGRPRVAIECKDVEATGSLDEMRAFLARLYDVTLLHAHHRHMTYPAPRALHPGSPNEAKHRAIVTYWQENRRTKNIIARRTGFVSGTVPLADYHRIEPHQNISVGSSTVNDLVASVAEWAQRNV
ncbi:hypothetical protein FJ936_06625 [Mesorhizobium sp. B2-4-13]|uniref:hypothetical protein n=1 Tax=Mesorhizobium sp. B2-4-13 TaxID=2589936 RepID=UPI00114E321C|nr:hypothetical protein [Mesorhizobium sp. B2-4-13]TPK87018.1 hypothetical protein FJ936_06625 [Mesorhizobium sp. B2-4-13]